jgi:ABC-type dipeptide/oligopeptide/nickel transport system ATPase component
MAFNMNFERGQIMVFVGKQGSGKSFTLRALIKQFSQEGLFEFGQVFSGSSFNSDYDFMPKGSVDSEYSEEKFARYIQTLRNWLEKNPKKKLPPNFLIMDDLLGKIKPNTGVFSNLVACYRHYSMTLIITSQYLNKNVSTLLREMTDVAFIYQSRFRNTRESLYNSYGQMLENQDEFDAYLEDATKEKYSCLVYQAGKDTKEEAYLSYKSPSEDKPFKLKFKPIKF